MSIKYTSTRGQQRGLSFEEVVLGGLATDKGLFVPESIPKFAIDEIIKMKDLSFHQLAFEVISKFVGPEDVPPEKLKIILENSFSTFRTLDVTPSVKLKDFWVLELFHGPTFAFKDVALQFLGNLFEYFLTKGTIQDRITILGATSGDTGSAAIYGLRGKKNVSCFIMYPNGKVSDIQERQMITILDENVDCIAIEGDFDDAQAIVKAAFADAKFRDAVKLGAINSINWARVLAQITYYFYSWLKINSNKLSKNPLKYSELNYAVPTGNFGDILAGYYAKQMGLPINKLVVCTNENDVLHRLLSSGAYVKHPAVLTIAPSMDISVSSNFERYLYYLADKNSELLVEWMDTFEKTGHIELPEDVLKRAKSDFLSYASHKDEIVEVMKDLYQRELYLVCPHTATAVAGILSLKLPSQTTVCLATAHPAKFEEAVNLSLKNNKLPVPDLPEELRCLFSKPVKKTFLPKSLNEIKKFILSKVKKTSLFSTSWFRVGVEVGILTAAVIGVFLLIRKR